ncbi:hypothetical protein L218DRAFT_1016055 [Marasmius fiardii PR-910]|nr:hypothetical protein L218DRAFT_1016055 [Marasmius fiardii PR-910]
MAFRSILGALFVVSAVVASPTHSHSKRAFNVYSDCQNNNQIALTSDDGPFTCVQSSTLSPTPAPKQHSSGTENNFDCIYNQDRVYAYNAGHQIGSHTWSHADLTTLSNDQILDGMYRVEEALAKILGVLPGFMRPSTSPKQYTTASTLVPYAIDLFQSKGY